MFKILEKAIINKINGNSIFNNVHSRAYKRVAAGARHIEHSYLSY